jgi:hypothetical protein
MGLFLVLYDIVILPLGFFNIPEIWWIEAMAWITRFFWTFDIPMALITGFLRLDGTIEMRPGKILRHYLVSWFCVDALIVGSDWFELIGSGLGFGRLAKATRAFRIIRMLRLLRLAKIQQFVRSMVERIHSEALGVILEILQIIAVILIVAHVLGCVWWGIGSKDGENTWVAHYDYKHKTFEAQYGMSLHWSFTQFTGGMDEIVAQNPGERFFIIGAYLVCFIQASLFLSSLTSAMTRLHLITNRQVKQIQTLRRFLHQNGISGRTALRIQRNAQHAIAEQQRFMPEKEVELLEYVSEPLRFELHFEMYAHIFETHLFFARYKEECPAVMRKICHFAFSTQLVSRSDVLFSAGELPSEPKSYVFFEGMMHYRAASDEIEVIETEQWIAESALWTKWMHRGVLTALADCRLCALSVKKFIEIIDQFEQQEFDPRQYAKAYVEDLNELLISDVTDLSIHLTSPGVAKHHLKPDTHVAELLMHEYQMKIGHQGRQTVSRQTISPFSMRSGSKELRH